MTVYFIQTDTTGICLVKIGKAKSVKRRFAEIRTHCPFPLKILREINDHPNDSFAERWLHTYFHENRLEGEWFKFSAEMLIVSPPLHPPVSEPRPMLNAAIPQIGLEYVGPTLRAARLEAGISIAELSDTVGLSSQLICDIEAGRRALKEKYISSLPMSIKQAVVGAMIENRMMAIEELRRELVDAA